MKSRRNKSPSSASAASAAPPAAQLSCRLGIKVVPGASCDEIAGEHGDAIRVKLRAPPVDGRANAALLAFLAERLGLPASALRLVTGETARHKVVAISGLAIGEVRRRLLGAS